MGMDLETVIERHNLGTSLQEGSIEEWFVGEFGPVYRVKKVKRIKKSTGLAVLDDFVFSGSWAFSGFDTERGKRAALAFSEENLHEKYIK